MNKDTYQLLPDYSYRGVRAMILLQDRHLREFVAACRKAKALNCPLPVTTDPAYVSYEALLTHILRASRGYLIWLCQKLEVPAPQIDAPPAPEAIEREAEAYIDYLYACWTAAPLAAIPEEAWNAVHKSRWDVDYSLDAMLEHAAMHPIRHAFQVGEWIQRHNSNPQSK